MNRIANLIERAKQEAGLDHFGADGWQEGLERLVHSAEREAGHTQTGAAVFDGTVVDLLRQRLEIESWFARHPEIDDEQIVAPLIGGLIGGGLFVFCIERFLPAAITNPAEIGVVEPTPLK